MKKVLLIILFATNLVFVNLQAQNISLVMNPKPSPFISDWQTQTEIVKLVITNTSASNIQVKIKTEIYDGANSLVAKTVFSRMNILEVSPGISIYNAEDVLPAAGVDYFGKSSASIGTTGRIPDDNYKICVSLLDLSRCKLIVR
jgi:hypothetical protein